MSKKAILAKLPTEVVERLDNAAKGKPRSSLSIKLLRLFFKENPPLRDMSGLLSQEIQSSTLRLPEDLVVELDNFADSLASNRHSAMLLALVAAMAAEGFIERPVLQAGK